MTIKLIKLRMMAAFGQIARGNSKKGTGTRKNSALMIGVYIFVAAVFAFIFTMLATLIAPVLIAINADWFYFLLFIGIDVTLVFVFGVFETKSEIFECKDNELLLSMPIKPRDIVMSRIISVIIWNYIESALVFLPAIIVYAVYGGMIKGIIGAVILLLFIPLLPTALSCLVGYAVSVVASKFKRKTFISVIFFVAFFAAYMFGYSSLINGVDSMLLNVEGFADSAGRLAFLYAIGNAALLKPLPLVLLCFASLASAVGAIVLISLGFERIAFSNRGEKRIEYKEKRTSRRSVMFSLTKKELSRFTSSATYIINSALGIVFMLIFAIYAAIKMEQLGVYAAMFSELLSIRRAINAVELTAVALVSVLAVCASFSYMSSCSLSLEGKSLWIIKSMPISGRTVLLSKVLSHLAVTTLPMLISSVILICATGDVGRSWYYILVPQGVAVIGALVGILWNTAFPKFEFTNEAAVIKNSASVFLTMLTVMLVGAALAVMGIWLLMRVSFAIVALIELGTIAVVIAALVLILIKFATVKYDSL